MFKIYNLGQRFFFLYGCLSLGVFNSQILFTYLMIFLGPATFIFLEINFSNDSYYLSVISISLVSLDSLTIILFLGNVFSDAGIMRPGLASNSEDPKEKFKLIQYKNETFTVKFCDKCRIFRALRAHHCKFCDVCVEEYDHHSQMISNCVGKRNRKRFFLMLTFCVLTILEVFVLCLYNLLDEKTRDDRIKVIYSLVFLVLCSFLFFSVGMMLCLQTYLISQGMTTLEYFRGGYKKNSQPFNEGVLKNWWNFIKRRRTHRTVDLKYLKSMEKEHGGNDSIEINLQSFQH